MLNYLDRQPSKIRSCTKKIFKKVAQSKLNPNIRYVILFGSEARGEAVLSGDIDLALYELLTKPWNLKPNTKKF